MPKSQWRIDILIVDQEQKQTYTRSYIELEMQKRMILQDIKNCVSLFDLIADENGSILPIGDVVNLSDSDVFIDGPEHVLFGLANIIGFDFDKLFDYHQLHDRVAGDIEDDEDFKTTILEHMFENNDVPVFSEFLTENEDEDEEINELIDCYKEIESKYQDYLKLTGLKWFDTPFAYYSSIDVKDNEPYFDSHLKRQDMLIKKNAFTINGDSLDVVVFFHDQYNDYDYNILNHDGFEVFALKDMEPVFRITGTNHYLSGYYTFENSLYYNAKDAMSQFDADFAHYLIDACENGLVKGGKVCDLLASGGGCNPLKCVVHFEGIYALSDVYDSYELMAKFFEATLKTMDKQSGSIMASEQQFHYTDVSSYTSRDDYMFSELHVPWNGISYAFMDDLHKEIPDIKRFWHCDEDEKQEEIDRHQSWGDHFNYAAEHISDADIKGKFMIYSAPQPESHAEDLMRLAAHNDFYGMFQNEKQNEESTETI